MKMKNVKMLSGLFAATVALLSGQAFAGQADFKVLNLGCSTTGLCFITVDTAPINGCSGTDQFRFQLSQSSGGTPEMYKTALSAFLAGRRVGFNWTDNTCFSGGVAVNYLYVI